jgi:signal transduction histidine kinase
MNKRLSNWNRVTAAFIVAVLLLCTFWSVRLFQKEDFNAYDNKVRIMLSKEITHIERGIYKKGTYPYLVFDLKGKVLYGEKPFEERKGDWVYVQEMLQYDMSFAKQYEHLKKESFVLEQNQAVIGFVVFLIPKQDITLTSMEERVYHIFLPMLLGMIICLIVIMSRTIYVNRCVLSPLREMSRSAKAIIAGNYDMEVVRIFGSKIRYNEVGELTYSFELMRDELKEKQVREEALKKSQQELISCISHDLKTPLSTIKAYGEGLRDQIVKTPEKQKEYVDIILNKTDLLIEMIEDLLEFSNAELNQLDIQREEVYFTGYFATLMRELELYVRQNGMEFLYHLPESEFLVVIDKKRITEVMYNLIENSMKYIGEHSGKVEVYAEREGKQLCIRVIDNGIGISADDIPYLFDKFYRGEKSRSSSVPGSGLGLSICKYIINEHKGEIYCRSRKNHGCEIGFTLNL